MSEIFLVEKDAEIESCFDMFKALRPHIKSKATFLSQVRRQEKQSYHIVEIKNNNRIESAAGFRVAEFLAWGRVLYLDDLTTLPEFQGRGYGSQLMDWLIEYAKSNEYQALHLDTDYSRHNAHRLYLKKGLELNSHHLSVELI